MELHGGNIYKIAKELNIKKEDIIDFSSNINPLGVSEKLKKEIINNLNIVQSYPDPDYQDLKSVLSEYNNTDASHIIVGNGATELIYLFARAIKPATALILAPSFAEYTIALNQAGVKINYFGIRKEDDFNLNLDALKNELSKQYNLVIICNPNNPTSTYINQNDIEEVLSFAGKYNTTVMLDESFLEFVDPGLISRTDNLYSRYKNVFILRSLTKYFALPGLRLGYAVSYNSEHLSKLRKNQEPWTVNVIAELAAKVLIGDKEYIKNIFGYVDTERRFLSVGLKNISWIKAYNANANFFLLEILNDITSAGLKSELLKSGILIRDASNFKYLDNKFVRIAVKDRKSNQKLLECLAQVK
jgi:threonine-phosphate decarboxylase